MTKQDDLDRHDNRLQMRSAQYGGSPYFYDQQDRNYLAGLRHGGDWNVIRVPYVANQVVIHHGFPWVAIADTSQEPSKDATDWKPLAGLNGRGGMDMGGTNVPAGDIGSGWNPLTEFDAEPITPLGCSFNLPTGQFQFLWPGVWVAGFYFTFEHNSSNQGRATYIRVFDVTNAVPMNLTTIIATGRNQEATTASFNILVEVTAAMVGDLYRFEVGGGSGYSSVLYDALSVDLLQGAAI